MSANARKCMRCICYHRCDAHVMSFGSWSLDMTYPRDSCCGASFPNAKTKTVSHRPTPPLTTNNSPPFIISSRHRSIPLSSPFHPSISQPHVVLTIPTAPASHLVRSPGSRPMVLRQIRLPLSMQLVRHQLRRSHRYRTWRRSCSHPRLWSMWLLASSVGSLMIKFHVEESDRIVKFAINSQSTDLLDCLSPTTIKTQATHTPITRRLLPLEPTLARATAPIGVKTPMGTTLLPQSRPTSLPWQVNMG
jgi:hypothetical protein